MYTLKQLQELPPHSIIDSGEVINSPEGVFMTDSDIGRTMRWVAKRGLVDDWAIYIHWSEHDIDYIKRQGTKITTPRFIEKLVPCDEEMLKRYRY
jgi:hypothetical protein